MTLDFNTKGWSNPRACIGRSGRVRQASAGNLAQPPAMLCSSTPRHATVVKSQRARALAPGCRRRRKSLKPVIHHRRSGPGSRGSPWLAGTWPRCPSFLSSFLPSIHHTDFCLQSQIPGMSPFDLQVHLRGTRIPWLSPHSSHSSSEAPVLGEEYKGHVSEKPGLQKFGS